MRDVKALFLFLFFFTILLASETKENIAIIAFKGDVSESESTILTDKLISEVIKKDVYTVVERSQMAEILKEQGFQQTGCTNDQCAVEMGQLLGVRKIIISNLGKVGNIYSISLKIINVENGAIIRTVTTNIKGKMEDVLKEGIAKVADDVCYIPMTAEEIEADYQKRLKTKKVFAFTTGGVGLVAGGLATWFWIDRKSQHDSYMSSVTMDDIKKYKDARDAAKIKAIAFTAGSGVLLTTSTILFIAKTKKKENPKVSLGGYFSPTLSNIQLTYNF